MNYIKLKKLSKNESGMYGLSASASKFNKNYPEYLRITDIDNFGNIPPVLPTSVDINQYPKWHKFLLSKDDIVFARTGSVGRNYFFNAENRKIVFGGYLIKFSLNTNLVIPKYVSYYCQTDSYWKQLKKLFVGSIMNNINEKQYENLTIPLLAKTSQQHIVNIISHSFLFPKCF